MGVLAYRELDEALGPTSAIDSELSDIRMGKNTRHGLGALLRQSIYSRLAGYEDTNDAERLAVDPAMRHVAGGRAVERSAASTSVMSRFETEMLTHPKKPIVLYHSFRYQATSWAIRSQSSRQDRVACGRAFSPSRLHCDESSVEIQQCGEVL